MSRPPKLRDTDPWLHLMIVVMWVVVAVCIIFAVGKAWAASKPPHYSLWLCVHRQERTPWSDDDPPYWGGLQMGAWFLRTYAHPPGTPDQWSPLTQMWVAENAYRREHYSRRWLAGQWPPSVGVCF